MGISDKANELHTLHFLYTVRKYKNMKIAQLINFIPTEITGTYIMS